MLAQQLANGLATGLLYGLLALGFSLAYSTTRVVNFAHGDFFALGALVAIFLERTQGLSHVSASLLAEAIVTTVALLFAFFCMWTLRSPLQRSVATIALSLGLRDGMLLMFGSDSASFPQSGSGGAVHFLGVSLPAPTIALITWTLALLGVFWFFLTRTRWGVWMRATAQDPELAATSGISIRSVESMAFGLAIFAAVAAGVLVGPSWQVSYAAGSVVGVKAFTAAMLGGLGRLGGAVIGGILLGVTEALFAGYVSSTWKDLAVYLLLLLTLLFLPHGLFALRSQRIGG